MKTTWNYNIQMPVKNLKVSFFKNRFDDKITSERGDHLE